MLALEPRPKDRGNSKKLLTLSLKEKVYQIKLCISPCFSAGIKKQNTNGF